MKIDTFHKTMLKFILICNEKGYLFLFVDCETHSLYGINLYQIQIYVVVYFFKYWENVSFLKNMRANFCIRPQLWQMKNSIENCCTFKWTCKNIFYDLCIACTTEKTHTYKPTNRCYNAVYVTCRSLGEASYLISDEKH